MRRVGRIAVRLGVVASVIVLLVLVAVRVYSRVGTVWGWRRWGVDEVSLFRGSSFG
jgi:hypothetical protein